MLLEIEDLQVDFDSRVGPLPAVDGVSLTVDPGETVALVGESGCGKTMTALSVLGLVPSPPGRISAGSIRFEGQELIGLADEDIRDIRGNQISMIFQEPMTSLNPVLSIGLQLTEAMRRHQGMTRRAAMNRAAELLQLVGISEPERRLRQYPHHFSGGMRQRVMIAIAMSCNPKVIVADEPTTALDVTIQAQILELLKGLTRRFDVALMIITHNLGVVARYADRVNVMYAGRIVETGTTTSIYGHARHPYTIGLLNSVPRMDRRRGERLTPIEGQPPTLFDRPAGCAYGPRCAWTIDKCAEAVPPLAQIKGGGRSACFRRDEL